VLARAGGPVEIARALAWVRQALSGLDYAHQQRVIHRDIKTSNIMLDHHGQAKVTDFGIALMIGGKRLTSTGVTLGTAQYMSPEQILRPKDMDHRADVYSMGVVLYELVTGRVPFDDDTDFVVKEAQVKQPPPPPRSINPDIPATLEHIILKALEKDPDQRYSGCGEFAKAIEIFEHEEAATLRSIPEPRGSGRRRFSPRVVAAIVAPLIAVLALGSYGIKLWDDRRAGESARRDIGKSAPPVATPSGGGLSDDSDRSLAMREAKAQRERELEEANAKLKSLEEAKAKRERELEETHARLVRLEDAKAKQERELEAKARQERELKAKAERERVLEATAKQERDLKAKAERERLLEATAKQERELKAKAERERELEAKVTRERESEQLAANSRYEIQITFTDKHAALAQTLQDAYTKRGYQAVLFRRSDWAAATEAEWGVPVDFVGAQVTVLNAPGYDSIGQQIANVLKTDARISNAKVATDKRSQSPSHVGVLIPPGFER